LFSLFESFYSSNVFQIFTESDANVKSVISSVKSVGLSTKAVGISSVLNEEGVYLLIKNSQSPKKWSFTQKMMS